MSVLTELAHAKINLTLDVLYRRPDGYHEVEMVMQSLELADWVTLRRVRQGITLKVSSREIPGGEKNLAWRAAELMFGAFGCSDGVEISLDKRIPVAAGLAGGSADAAAVIRGINRLWNLDQSLETLCKVGASLGSDIPFCVREGTALAKGRGELLTPLPALPEVWLVLVKPPLGVSTAKVYGAFRPERVESRPDTSGILRALQEAEYASVPRYLCNVLEPVTMEMVPEVKEIKNRLLEAGAINALMSGSGPTVFGIARDQNHAERMAKAFEHTGYVVEVTRTY